MVHGTQNGRDIAALARLLADDTRASVCDALMDGRAWTAGELATSVGVAPATMSEHLNRLVDAGLLVEERQGHHRYVRLADAGTARLLELLGSRIAAPPHHPVGYRQVRADEALRAARTCYDHLAGRLGVALADALGARGLLDTCGGDMTLTPTGDAWGQAEGLDLAARSSRSSRPLVRPCLDWTERRHHVGGRFGAALCQHLLATGALVRTTPKRAVGVTPAGELWFRDRLSIEVPATTAA